MPSKPQSWVLIIVTDHRLLWRSQSVAGSALTTVAVKRTKRFERCALMFPGLANSYMTLSTPDTGRRSVMTMLLHKSGKKH